MRSSEAGLKRANVLQPGAYTGSTVSSTQICAVSVCRAILQIHSQHQVALSAPRTSYKSGTHHIQCSARCLDHITMLQWTTQQAPSMQLRQRSMACSPRVAPHPCRRCRGPRPFSHVAGAFNLSKLFDFGSTAQTSKRRQPGRCVKSTCPPLCCLAAAYSQRQMDYVLSMFMM